MNNPLATDLLLWTASVALLVLLALVPYFRPAIRVLLLASAVLLMWLAWAVHGVEWMASTLEADAPAKSAVIAENVEPQVRAEEPEATAPNSETKKKTDELTRLERVQRLGATGDLFGGINALFAALAFGGVAIAAYLQFGTNRQARIQSFEVSFYSAIDLLHRIAEGLALDATALEDEQDQAHQARLRLYLPPSSAAETVFNRKTLATGRTVFATLVAVFAEHATTHSAVLQKYRTLQKHHNHVIGHYFRHLFQVLKLIDRQPDDVISRSEKAAYASVLRAQLSTSELAILTLNCTGDMVDRGEFRNLLVQYRMLEHLPFYRSGSRYLVRGSDLVIGDAETMRSFMTHTPITGTDKTHRGAFGTNSEAAQLDASSKRSDLAPAAR